MNEYVLLIVGTVLISTFLTAILPEGKMQGLIKGIAKLVCVLTMISPMIQFLHKGMDSEIYKNVNAFFEKSGIETSSNFIKYYSELRIENAANQIEKELSQEFSVQTLVEIDWGIEKTGTYFSYENEKIKIYCIHIQTMEEVGEEVKSRMFQHVKDNYCSEVLIE